MAMKANANIQTENGSEGQFEAGCPMLIHAAADHPILTDRVFMRCALGWSVYSTLSQARCAATHAVENCWQEHPELTPLIESEPESLPFRASIGKVAAD